MPPPADRGLARNGADGNGADRLGDFEAYDAVAGFRVWSSGGNRWHLAGEADLLAQAALQSAMHDASASGTALVLDCGDLSFIDVAGLRAIAQAARVAGAPVTVNGANDTLRRFWSLLGLDTAAPNVEFST